MAGRCSAHKKRTGEPCGAPAMANGKCKVHGGASLAGSAHPRWIDGRSSRYRHLLSADRQEDFQAALAAPDPLNLLDEIALVRTTITEVVAPGPDYYALKRLIREIECGLEKILNEEEATPEIEVAVRELLGHTAEAYEAMTGASARTTDNEKLCKQLDQLRRLVDTSARVMDIRANSFTRIQSQALIARLVELIAGNVRDPQDRKRLITSLAQIGDEVAPARQIAERKAS